MSDNYLHALLVRVSTIVSRSRTTAENARRIAKAGRDRARVSVDYVPQPVDEPKNPPADSER